MARRRIGRKSFVTLVRGIWTGLQTININIAIFENKTLLKRSSIPSIQESERTVKTPSVITLAKRSTFFSPNGTIQEEKDTGY